jgi:hypothetical protein
MQYLLKDNFKIIRLATLLILTGAFLINCPNPVGLSSFDAGKKGSPNTGDTDNLPNAGNFGQSPWSQYFAFTEDSHYYNFDDKAREAKIVKKPGTTAEVENIYYEGIGSTVYEKTKKAPTEIGNYAVTYDIIDEERNLIRGLYAGILTIENIKDWLPKQKPLNNAGKPHEVKWHSINIADVQSALSANKDKYVFLDLYDSGIFNTGIGANAFESCEGLTGIILPDNITSIGNRAFYGCDNLIKVDLPEKVTSIENSTFFGCTSLITVKLPETVVSIGTYAFANCIRLSSINLPAKVTSIGDYAFKHCVRINSITIPDKVTSIGVEAFYNCNGLTGINIPYGVEDIRGYTFATCIRLASINIPDTVTTIGPWAFVNCGALSGILTIPDSVKTIYTNAFGGSRFSEVIIGKDVKTIQNLAFNISTLDSVTFKDTIPNTWDNFGGSAFNGDLRNKFYATDSTNGTPGTYTRSGSTWTKQ